MIRKLFCVCAIIYCIFPSVTAAHPGNTDSSGGHTCRTNCEDWGLYYGEYHYHDGSYSEPQYDPQAEYDLGYNEGYNIAYENTSECELDYGWEWEGTQEYGDGFEDGKDAGHQDGLEVCYKNSYDAGMENGENDSNDGLEYDEGINYDGTYDYDSYIQGYSEGYDEEAYDEAVAVTNKVETATTQDNESADPSADSEEEFPAAGYIAAAAAGIVVLSVAHDHYRFRKGRKNND